jgi:hypothetical protein
MSKWKDGYKVVELCDGKYISCMTQEDQAVVTYMVGTVSVPREGAGPLCVFTAEDAARHFAEVFADFSVFTCRYTESRAKHVWFPCKQCYIRRSRMWEPLAELPHKTALATQVLLLEEVK